MSDYGQYNEVMRRGLKTAAMLIENTENGLRELRPSCAGSQAMDKDLLQAELALEAVSNVIRLARGEVKTMSDKCDKNEPTELTNEWGELEHMAHKVLSPWDGTHEQVHAILGAHREVLESKNLEYEEDDWLEAASLYPEGVYGTVPGGCSYSMHNVVRWYLVAKREDNR